MRTEDQIKRKLLELSAIHDNIEHGIAMMIEASNGDGEDQEAITVSYANLECVKAQIEILEWVLNAPIGSYHS